MTQLTQRQRAIIVAVGRDGLQWDTIAMALDIHESTVKSHVRRIIRKFGCDRKPREALIEIYWRYVVHMGDT